MSRKRSKDGEHAVFPSVLQDALWHTTSIDRYRLILSSGAILADPPLNDAERWCTQGGPDLYPFVRHLGGVSLFEFRAFDHRRYSRKYMASWHVFIPFNAHWVSTVWIEINNVAIAGSYRSPAQLARLMKNSSAYQHNLMPEIEAASLAPIPIGAFGRVLVASRTNPNPEPLRS